MKAPESRIVFLIRDPRDVAASALDAHGKGSRPSEWRRTKRPELFETSISFMPETDMSPPNSHLSALLGFKLGGQPLYILPVSGREPYKMSDTPSRPRLGS